MSNQNNIPDPSIEVLPPSGSIELNSNVIQPSSMGFENYQKDECAEKDFITAAPFCPTCIIDENATPDNWKDPQYDEEVFLDKTKCEYVAVMEVKLENLKVGDTKQIDDRYEEYKQQFLEEWIVDSGRFGEGSTGEAIEWMGPNPPPEASEAIAYAEEKALEKIQDLQSGLGTISDTINGVYKLGAFDRLIDWARDPDRIRLGIKSILEDQDKLVKDDIVCAFGGCVYSAKDVKENKEMIGRYIMGLNASQKSLNEMANKYNKDAPAIAKLFLSPVWALTYLTGGIVSWVGDIFGLFGDNQAEREVAKKFEDALTGFFPSNIKNSLERLQSVYGTVNPYALEWVAYVPDGGVYLLPDSDIVRYIVRVPAFNVDILPEDLEESKDTDEKFTEAEIVLENSDWRVKYTEMNTGLTLMRYEHDIFKIRDNGSITYDEEGATSFDMISFADMKESLKTFKKQVEKLLDKNNMAFSYQKANPFTFVNYLFHKTVTNVRITLAKEDQNGIPTLVVDKVFVTIEGCPEVELTTKKIVSFNKIEDKTEGSISKDPDSDEDPDVVSQVNPDKTIYKKAKYLKTFKTRITGTRADSSLLYILSSMDVALMGFQSEKKIPVTKWAEDFIFPSVKINNGLAIGENENDKTNLGCILENFPLMTAESWSSILDDLILGTWDVFRDELRTRMCNQDEKSIDPGLQRWFASKETQQATNELYEASKQGIIKARKEKIDEVVLKAQQEAFAKSLGTTLGNTDELFEAVNATREAEGKPPIALTEVDTEAELEEEISELLNPDQRIPPDILANPKKLERWKREQLEVAMPAIKKFSKKQAKALSSYTKDLHPYMGDLKESIMAQLPDYDESLTKKFIDFFSFDNPTKPEEEGEAFFQYLSDIGLCGLLLGLRKALGCLFGQLDLQTIILKIAKKIIGSLRIDQFVYFMTELLPTEDQLKVTEEVNKIFNNMFEGTVITLDATEPLNSALYEKRLEGTVDPKLYALGLAGSSAISAATRIGDIISTGTIKKYDRLNSKYKDYPANKIEKEDAQLEKDRKKAKKLVERSSKRLKKRNEKDELRNKKGFPKQGSIGKAGGQIAGVILKAYMDAILSAFSGSGLVRIVKQLPVVAAIPDLVFDFFTCPSKPLINPPLKEMIKFNFKTPNFCDPTKPIVSFNFSKLENPFKNPWKFLRDAFVAALTKVITRILIKIVVQFIVEFEKMLCKMLEVGGRAALNFATGNFDENPLTEAFRDTFCGENATDEEVKKAMAGAMKTTGIASKSEAANVSKKIASAVSGVHSKREMLLVIFSPSENMDVVRRVSKTIITAQPTMASFFDPPESAANFFSAMANVLPRDHKEQIRAALDEMPVPDEPIFNTICLTEAELEAWNNLRAANLEERGLSPQDAADAIGDYQQDAEDTIDDLLESDNIENQIEQLLSPIGGRDPFGDLDPSQTPPGCEDKEKASKINSLVDEPEELVEMSNKVLDRLWRVVDMNFISELYGSKNGILSRILSDTDGTSFAWHAFYRRFFITRHWVYDSIEQEELQTSGPYFDPMFLFKNGGYFPATIGMHLFEELQKNFEFKSRSLQSVYPAEPHSLEYDPFLGFAMGSSIRDPVKFKIVRPEFEKPEASMKYQVPVVIDGDDKTNSLRYKNWQQSVLYSSQVLSPEIEENFNYRISVKDCINPFLSTGDLRTGSRRIFSMKINQQVSSDVDEYLLDFVPPPGNRYRSAAFDYTLNKIFKKYMPDSEIRVPVAVYDKMISKTLNVFRDICLDLVPRDGQGEAVERSVIDEDGKMTDKTETVSVPSGFLFGYVNSEIDPEAVEYVGPNGEEYDYDEEEQVLGKITHPRFRVLDPKKYGGSYNNPPYYVEDAEYKGWMNMAKIIAPDISGCKPSRQNMLRINDVISHVKKAKNQIKLNEKLFQGRGDCFYHVPFDRLIGRESRAMIEGCIKTVIRVNVIEQLIGALPILGFIEYNEKNFDSSFANMIAKRIQDDLSTTNVGIFPRKIEKQNYWLSFLEMATQMYWRMWESDELDYKNEDGENQLPSHVEDIFEDLRILQEEYNWVNGMWHNPSTAEGVFSKSGLIFGDRSERSIYCPDFYYDFDNKKFRDPSTVEEPVYEISEPIDITYEEYLSAVINNEAYFSEAEAIIHGGAYLVSPTAEELLDDPEYGWLSPPPDAIFAKRSKVFVGYEQVTKQKPIISIDGPYPATFQEWVTGLDSEPLDNQAEPNLVRRASVESAEAFGGISKASGANDPFAPNINDEYVKYRRIIDGYEPLYSPQDPFDFQSQYAHYCALAYQIYGDGMLYSDDKIKFGDSIKFGPNKFSWQFASCMWAVRGVQDKCMSILTELINIEIKQIMQTFNERWEPQLLDIGRYILNTDLFVDNGLKNFGTRDHEEKVAGGSVADMGEVANVVINAYNESAFASLESNEDVSFKIEKYIRVVEKEVPEGKVLPEPFKNRDVTLMGVVNIEHFQAFIDNNKEEYGDYYISDLFGDAKRMYSFRFSQVFRTLYDNLKPVSKTPPKDSEKLSRTIEVDTENYDPENPSFLVGENLVADARDLKIKAKKFFEKYSIDVTQIQIDAFAYAELQTETDDQGQEVPIDYGEILLPKDLVNEEWFLRTIPQSQASSMKPAGYDGDIGLKYGIRIVANLPSGCGIPEPSFENLGKSNFALEKCFYMNVESGLDEYEKNYSLPIAFAEIDIIDHQIKDFGWEITNGTASYPMDVDCLLRMLIKTPEYQTIFKHIMNPTCVTSMSAILSGISFDSSIGYKDGWVKLRTFENPESGEEEGGMASIDQDLWERKYFHDTRMFVRKVFSGFYLSDDFDDPDVDMFDWGELMKAAFGNIYGWLKKGFSGLSWWMRRNEQDNPFDADGEECKSEYEKLLE